MLFLVNFGISQPPRVRHLKTRKIDTVSCPVYSETNKKFIMSVVAMLQVRQLESVFVSMKRVYIGART